MQAVNEKRATDSILGIILRFMGDSYSFVFLVNSFTGITYHYQFGLKFNFTYKTLNIINLTKKKALDDEIQ